MNRHSDVSRPDAVDPYLDNLSELEQGAYPIVQPMKAALYFDSVKGFGEWRILISSRADKMLRKERKDDATTFKIIIKKIKELSNGIFSANNHRKLHGPSTGIPIFRAKVTGELRLVYQIDCAPDFGSEDEIQVIKIYGIYTLAQLDGRFWDSVSHQLSRHGKEYSFRCNQRKRSHQAGRDVILPCIFPPREESTLTELPHDVLEQSAEMLDDIHSLLHLDKYVALSQALLFSMLADLDVEHVFSVSLREKEIIEHPYSCYVLGRSGTGKTTTMLIKMLGIERAWDLRVEEVPKVRQLFVTKSQMLAEKVEEYFTKLVASLSAASKSPEELKALAAAQNVGPEGEAMVDKDDELRYRSDLPAKFSLLTDQHFPLFITFDHLCKLLEADVVEDALQPASRRFISANVFSRSYWPHLPLTKGLDSSLVFSEFIGVIKGSEEALAYKDGFLDQEGYERLSSRTQPAFAHQRTLLYRNFQAYCKLKKRRGDYDTADRTRALVEGLQHGSLQGKEVDYLYVDEAQDNLLIDAMILRALCKNPHGLFWAGDTAQTISVGSSFRFDDLKAFLFRIEHDMQGRIVNSGTTRRMIKGPRMFQLAVNYRSHGGIVNCAHSVIQLITEFWPYAIDNLAPEQGIVDGLKPIFLSTQDQDMASYKAFLFGDKERHIEFGAEQCIIVRDDTARNELREQVGDVGLIMTPYETKGLEFNDILLYNFFQDSAMDFSQWRVILNALEPSQRAAVRAPSFDETRHAGLCSELKILYVSITRARRNVWIVDDSEKSEPMRAFWISRDLVIARTLGADDPSLAVRSSQEEWEKTARSLFKKKRYAHAMQCFERASLQKEAAVAHAYLLREEAQAMPSGESHDVLRTQAFTKAAEAFIKSAASASMERTTYYRIAAECFRECAKLPQAARSYIDAGEFDIGAQLYLDSEMHGHAIRVIREHKRKMRYDIVDQILFRCRLYYFQKLELTRARSLFTSDKEALDFTESHDFDEAHVALLVRFGRRTDAAEYLLSKGQAFEAHEILVHDFKNKLSIRRVTNYVLNALREHFPFGSVPITKNRRHETQELLRLATLLNDNMLSSNDQYEISMFEAMVSMDISQLLKLGRKFHFECTNHAAAVLCFDHVFKTSHQATSLSGQNATTNLPAFFDYARLLKKVALDFDPSKDAAVQKLLRIQLLPSYDFLIPIQTELHDLLKSSPMQLQETDEGLMVPGRDLSKVVKQSLYEHLRRILSPIGTVDAMKDWPLPTTLLFIRQVIHDMLPIDRTALCGVLEYACGFLVVSMNYPEPNVRGVDMPRKAVLPQTWLQAALANLPKDPQLVDKSLSYVFVEPLAVLLQRVASQLHAARNSSIVILSRICRCLCLLGYNIPISALRLEILRAIISLPKNLRNLHNLSHYFNARNWHDLVIAVHKSTLGLNADKLVEFCHETGVSTLQRHIPDMEHAIHRNPYDSVPRLPTHFSSGKSSSVRADERLATGADRPNEISAVGNTVEPQDEGDVFEDLSVAMHNSRVAPDTGSVDKAPALDFIPSEIEKQAARILLHAYQRRRVARHRGVTKSTWLQVELSRIFSLCLKEAQHLQWPSQERIYRKVYLGALPHILLCLEEVRKYAHAAKTEAKERIKVAVGPELGRLGGLQTVLNQRLKTMDQLRKTLDPKSKVHHQSNLSLLKTSALQVQDLFLQLPPHDVEKFGGDLGLALRGILRASDYLTKSK